MATKSLIQPQSFKRPQFGLRFLFVATAAIAVVIAWFTAFRDVVWRAELFYGRGFCFQYMLLIGTVALIVAAIHHARMREDNWSMGLLAIAWQAAVVDCTLGIFDCFSWICDPAPWTIVFRCLYETAVHILTVPLIGTVIVLTMALGRNRAKPMYGHYLCASVGIGVIDLAVLLISCRAIFEYMDSLSS